MRKASLILSLSLVAGLGAFIACGSDDEGEPAATGGTGGGSPEQTGAVCEQASDCYPDLVDAGTEGGLEGAICLDEIRGGYCTHTCTADEDCCALEGECATDLPQVCSPFESAGAKMCFLSCEEQDMTPYDGGSGWADESEFCQREASSDFICRSSGGGTENRKICVPGNCGVGAACRTTDDCTADLTCITTLVGGYCGKADCTDDASCPTGSLCAKLDDGKNYCLSKCNADSDCSFCRPWDERTACSNEVTFVVTGTTGSVCAPTLL